MDPATSEVQEGDTPVAVDWVPPSSAVDDVTMDDTPVDVRVASLSTSDHEVEDGEILDEAMDVLDSQAAVPPTLEAATTHVLIEDIPVAAVQAPMTFVVAEVTMGENLVHDGGASDPTYDHEIEKGQSILEVVSETPQAATVEELAKDIPVVAVVAPPTSGDAEMTMGENPVVVGGASGGQSITEAVPTTSEATTVEVGKADVLVPAVQAPPTSVAAETANLDKVVLDVSDYLPIVTPDVTQNVRESSGISNDREMLKVLNNFCEAVPLDQDLQTCAPLVESDTPESSTRVPDPKVASGPQSEADLEAIGHRNVVESVAAAKDDTERGLPMNVAIGVPFDVESMREYFPDYNDKQWAGGKISIVTHCTDQFLLDNWENWFRTSIGGRKDGFRAEVRKNFLFFAGLEKHGLKVDWTTVDKSRNVREISTADRHAARVELWKRKTVFRGSLLYPEEPKLRYDERVPRKTRRKRTSRASSTPEGNETSPGTKKPTKRKLNLNPPKSRSSSPEVPRRIQPGRKGKRKVDEEATANIERKGKRKADEHPSPEPEEKKERSDDSDEDSDESIREQAEPIQYTRFAELGESEREKRRYGYMDKFISETIRDEIEKHTRPLKEEIERLNDIIEETARIALEQEQIYKLVNKREINLATLVATKFKEVRLRGHSESIANCDELNFLVTRKEKPVYHTDYDDFLEARKFGLKGSQWEKYAGVMRDDLEVKCPVCQDYIGLLPHMCPGTCPCKYHIGCFWPAASRRSVCTVCKVPFASKTYEFFNTRHIPPASKGSINPDTGELELDADQALDNEIHADVMAGRRDSFGPNNVDCARQSEDEKLWRRLVHKFLEIWHHGNDDVKFHTGYMKMKDPSLRSALEHTHNRLVQELEEEGRNSGLEESYIERMVSVFNDHINKTGDKNVKPMVYLRDWDENADAAGPSYAPMEISSEHDDEENDETYKPTAKSKASGSRKRVAHKPLKRGPRKPAPPHNPWITLSPETKKSVQPKIMVRGDIINTFMEVTFSQLPPSMTGCRYLSTYWFPKVEAIHLDKSDWVGQMEAARKWILPSPVVDWAEVPFMFIPIHSHLHWSLMVIHISTITGDQRFINGYHLDSNPGIHLIDRVGTHVQAWLRHTVKNIGQPFMGRIVPVKVVKQQNTYDCGVHVMALTRRLIEQGESLGTLLAKDRIHKLVKVADVKQLRNEILEYVSAV
ncbi:hypothetical protein R1sor_021848 [Riccia sorocarpa]|uniref:Ubiquitin-like protease family profile domain-containing protein n=1 Tax=Riccia sorocarpa TaxID=122646 RepID=A0ABD3GL64_9MARC